MAAGRLPTHLLQITALALAYGGAVWFGLQLTVEDYPLALIWPAAGIAVAVLVRFGRGLWPGVLVGGLVASLAIAQLPIVASVIIALVHTVQAWATAWWLERRGFDRHLGTLRDVASFGLVAVLAGPLAGSIVSVLGLAVANRIGWTVLPGVFPGWWLAELMGVLICAPPLLVVPPRTIDRDPRLRLEFVLVALGTLAVSALALGYLGPTGFNALLYLPVLGLLWASVRFGVAFAVPLLLAVNIMALRATANGSGPFAAGSVTQDLVLIWIFMGTASVSVLVIAALAGERMRAGQALRRSQRRLERAGLFTDRVIDSLPGVFYLFDEHAGLVRWNRRFEEVSGHSGSEMVGRQPLEFIAEADRERVAEAVREVFEAGESSIEALFEHGDGAARPYLLTGQRFEANRVRYLIGVGLDVSDRVAAETERRQQSEILQRIIDNIPIMICFIDAGQGLRLINREFERVLGWSLEEAGDLAVFDHLYPDPAERQSVLRHLLSATSEWREYRTTVRDGSVIDTVWATVRLTDGTIIGIGQDITENKRTREELQQIQKMESIGRLSAGIAHDFNNLLVPILGYVDTSLARLPEEDPVRADLLTVQSAATRAAELTQQILAFSRQQLLELRVVDLNDVVRDFQALIGRLIGEDVDLEVRLAEDLAPVRADAGQIGQVLMNLVVNARDAMPEGGRLLIATGNATLTSDDIRRHFDDTQGPGRYVTLTVRDWGIGMSETTRQLVFEPFFSSKAYGQGTGLGLSTVFGIIKQHHGYIRVETALGEGSTFTIYLPATDHPVPRSAATAAVGAVSHGGETVLVVEDDARVRELVCRVLGDGGYRVIEAPTPLDAVRLAAAAPEGIDLLLSDVVMPEMHGREVYRRIAEVLPGVRVLYMSGYPLDMQAGDDGDERTNFLNKPFTLAKLLAKVRAVLDLPAPS